MNDLSLYYTPYCPYCLKVLRFMKRSGIEIELRNAYEPEHLKTLVEVGGMDQVPCLFIDGKPMYESDDIIDYLRARFMN